MFSVMKRYIVGFMIVMSLNSVAQDIQFSQFFASALYLNPAFAGSEHHNRIMMHQRVQWPRIDAKYNTTMFAYDRYFDQYQSGFGVMILQDFQGSNDLRTTDLSMQYSYELRIDQEHTMRFGLQAGYLSRSVGYGLVFPHNLKTTGIDPSNPPDVKVRRNNAVDISTGWLFYSKNFYVSLSGHHLNTPNMDFTIVGVSQDPKYKSPLPAKYALVGGYKIPLKVAQTDMAYLRKMNKQKSASLTPTFHYKMQGKSDQLDLGLYLGYDQLITGVWYRGIPVKRYQNNFGTDFQSAISGFHNNESMVALIGWTHSGMDITYSYDFIVSRLRPSRTFAAHELNLTFVPHHYNRKPKIQKFIPCPIPMGGR